MRHAVIVKNPNGAAEVQFFQCLQDAKVSFKSAQLGDNDVLELWASTSGRVKRRKGKAAVSDFIETVEAVENEGEDFIEGKQKGRKARNK